VRDRLIAQIHSKGVELVLQRLIRGIKPEDAGVSSIFQSRLRGE
jgi:hypothetical protein